MTAETVTLTAAERRFLAALAAGKRVIVPSAGTPVARTVEVFGAAAGITLASAVKLHNAGLIDATERLRWALTQGVEITETGRAAAGEA